MTQKSKGGGSRRSTSSRAVEVLNSGGSESWWDS